MPDRISTEAKRDRDRRGRSFGCKRGRIPSRSDNCNATADEVGHERRQAIVLAAEPVVLDDHVLALNVAGFAEAFSERGRMSSGAIERPTADEAYHRHRRLLCARRERPRSGRAAEDCDELPPPHGTDPGEPKRYVEILPDLAQKCVAKVTQFRAASGTYQHLPTRAVVASAGMRWSAMWL